MIEKKPMKGSGLDFKSIGEDLKNKRIWIWLVLPIIMDAVCVILSMCLPEYINEMGEQIIILKSKFIILFCFALGKIAESAAKQISKSTLDSQNL